MDFSIAEATKNNLEFHLELNQNSKPAASLIK